MFDIKDYYNNFDQSPQQLSHDTASINEDISDDIDTILSERFESLYERDRYKYVNGSIEIIYPKLVYPGGSTLLITPDKVRYLLSFYPTKSDFHNINKIVLRPRFIEVGNIQLVSLYLRKKKIIVLYLCHPHFYSISNAKFNRYAEFISIDLEKIMQKKLISKSTENKADTELYVHPLWYIISLINPSSDGTIDKFFIKKESMNSTVYENLNDISFYYTRHGY